MIIESLGLEELFKGLEPFFVTFISIIAVTLPSYFSCPFLLTGLVKLMENWFQRGDNTTEERNEYHDLESSCIFLIGELLAYGYPVNLFSEEASSEDETYPTTLLDWTTKFRRIPLL